MTMELSDDHAQRGGTFWRGEAPRALTCSVPLPDGNGWVNRTDERRLTVVRLVDDEPARNEGTGMRGAR